MQKTAVAVAMLVLLLATTGFAYLMVWQRNDEARQQSQQHALGDIRFQLPGYWQVQSLDDSDSRKRKQLRDTQRPNRELIVTHLQLNEPATPQAVLRAAAMPRLFQLSQLRAGFNVETRVVTLAGGKTLQLAYTSLYTQDRHIQARSMEIIVVLTHDGINFWEFILREEVPLRNGDVFQRARYRNGQLLDELFTSITFN